MILALFWALLFVFLLGGLLFVFLSGVSRRGTSELGRDLYGYWLIQGLDSDEDYQRLTKRRSYCREFNQIALHRLTREVQDLTQRSDNPAVLAYLAAFHALRLAILVKGRVAAGRDDLRAVVGLEVLLARAAR